jgi:hypothetical protein
MKMTMDSTRLIFQKIAMALVLTGLMLSCGKDDPEPDARGDGGEVTPIGNPLGEAEQFPVGTSGGTIRSADGTIEIIIPEGALTSPATISVQQVENTAPNGIGNSYLVTPHDLVFAKPVTITFGYERDSVSFEDGLGVAFQDDDRIWYWPGNMNHDKVNRKITVETTHFSIWSVFETMSLDPKSAVVAPGGNVKIRFKAVFRQEDLLAPLTKKPLPLSDFSVEADYVQGWELIGEGALVTSGRTATYTAPKVAPDVNPVTVQVFVGLENAEITLQAFIYIGDNSVNLSYSPLKFKALVQARAMYATELGATIISYNAVAHKEDGTLGNDLVLVQIVVPGKGTGAKTWNDHNCLVSVTHRPSGSSDPIAGTVIVNVTEGDQPPIIHPGTVTIRSYGRVGGVIVGNFSGDLTFIQGETITYGKVTGSFFALRDPDI